MLSNLLMSNGFVGIFIILMGFWWKIGLFLTEWWYFIVFNFLILFIVSHFRSIQIILMCLLMICINFTECILLINTWYFWGNFTINRNRLFFWWCFNLFSKIYSRILINNWACTNTCGVNCVVWRSRVWLCAFRWRFYYTFWNLAPIWRYGWISDCTLYFRWIIKHILSLFIFVIVMIWIRDGFDRRRRWESIFVDFNMLLWIVFMQLLILDRLIS